MSDERLAYCGLRCDECPAYIATANNDRELLEATARRWSSPEYLIDPDDIRCNGCRSAGPMNKFCGQCQVRACASSRGLEHCGQCPDYPCNTLEGLWKTINSPEARETLESLR